MTTREQRLDTLKRLTVDDKFSAFLEQELQSVEATVYRVEYPELKARQFIPLKSDVAEGAESFAYRVWDSFGSAVWLSNYQSGLPTQAVRGEKIVGKVEGVGSAYSYSTHDLRAAAMANVPLDTELASEAMRSIERFVDEVAANGDSARGFIGFVNHPNVDVLSATGAWSGLTAAQILADLQRMAKFSREATKEIFSADTLLLPTAQYDLIATTLLNSTGSTSDTILTVFLKTQPWVKNVQSWTKLDGAGVSGADRAVCYKRDPKVLQLVVPMETRQHAPQPVDLMYKVPLEMRFGGMVVRQPKALVYMDGI